MSPRFIRNLVGVASLTGLALTLACGGNDSSKPVDPPVLNPSAPSFSHTVSDQRAVARHSYSLTASSTDPQNQKITYTAQKSNDGSAIRNVTGGHFQYVPVKGPTDFETVTITATNEGNKSATNDITFTVADNANPELPASVANVSLISGDTSPILELPTTDRDGDNVAWKMGDAGSFGNASGAVQLSGRYLTVDASRVNPGRYVFTLISTESGNGLTDGNFEPLTINAEHQVNVIVGNVGAPTPPVITPDSANVYLSHHRITLRVASTDSWPITYTATGTLGSAAASGIAVADNVITYIIPQTVTAATNLAFTVRATNSKGAYSESSWSYSVNKNNQIDIAIPAVTVTAGETATFTLPLVDQDGDKIGWSATDSSWDPAQLNQKVSINQASGLVSIITDKTDAGNKTVTLTSEEVLNTNNLVLQPDSKGPYTFGVMIKSAVGQAQITSQPPTGWAGIGYKKNMLFTARNVTDPSDKVASWVINDGLGVDSPDTQCKVAGGEFLNPTILNPTTGETVDQAISYEFLANESAPVGKETVRFGIRADFESGAVAYQSYTLDIAALGDSTVHVATRPNTPTANATELTFRQLPSGVIADGVTAWDPITVTGTGLVLKGAGDRSLDLIQTVKWDTNQIKIFNGGDKYDIAAFQIKLVSAKLNNTAQTDVKSSFGLEEYLPYTYVTNQGDTIYYPRPVTVSSVPAADDSTITATSKLVLTYMVVDKDDLPVGEVNATNDAPVTPPTGQQAQFTITIPFIANTTPTIDNYTATGWTATPAHNSSGTNDPDDNAWALNPIRPTKGMETIWKIPVSTTAADGTIGVTQGTKAYMVLSDVSGLGAITAPDGGITLTSNNTSTNKGQPATAFEIKWTPAEGSAANFSYKIQAYGIYGAASNEFSMNGDLWMSITGHPVWKMSYGNLFPAATPPSTLRASTDADYILSAPVEFAESSDYVLELISFDADTKTYEGAASFQELDEDSGFDNWEAMWKAGPYRSGNHFLISGTGSAKLSAGPRVTSTDGIRAGLLGDSNYFTYAYLKLETDEKPDLTTYIPMGALGARYLDSDTELDPITDADLIEAGGTYPGGVARSFFGNVFRLSDALPSNNDAKIDKGSVIQMVFPTIGQKMYAYIDGTYVPGSTDPTFPQAEYYSLLGWNSDMAAHASQTTPGSYKFNIQPLDIDLNTDAQQAGDGLLVFKSTEGDPNLLSVMTPVAATDAYKGSGGAIMGYNYYAMTRVSMSVADINGHYGEVPSTAAHPQVFTMTGVNHQDVTFNATVNRDPFKNIRPLLTSDVGSKADNTKVLSDNLQVLAYLSGTGLGATENPVGVPTYLEFGDLSSRTGVPFGDVINIANAIPIPKSKLAYDQNESDPGNPIPIQTWIGFEVPVVHYTVNFSHDGTLTGLPGSMGIITEDLSGLTGAGAATYAQSPVQNVRITVLAKDMDADPVIDDVDKASVPVSPYYTDPVPPAEDPVLTYPATAANAVAFENEIVYLTWDAPADILTKPISGYVIEFFPESELHPSGLPLYRLITGAETTQFPIHPLWAATLADSGELITIRIRAVAYGQPERTGTTIAGPGNLVDFNKTPFISALPANWSDVITGPIDFATFISMTWTEDKNTITFAPTTITLTPGSGTITAAALAAMAPSAITWKSDVPSINSTRLTTGAGTTAAPLTYKVEWADGGGELELAATGTNTLGIGLNLLGNGQSTTDWDKTVTATLEAKITHKGISNAGTLEFTSDGWRQGLDLDNPTFDKNVIEVSGMKTGETVTRTLTFGNAADTSVLASQPTYNWSVATTGTNATVAVVEGVTTNHPTIKFTGDVKLDAGEEVTLTATPTWNGYQLGSSDKIEIVLYLEDKSVWSQNYEIKFTSPSLNSTTKSHINLTPSDGSIPGLVAAGSQVKWEVDVDGDGTKDFSDDTSIVPTGSGDFEYNWVKDVKIGSIVKTNAVTYEHDDWLRPGKITITTPDDWPAGKHNLKVEITDFAGTATATGNIVINSDGWRPAADVDADLVSDELSFKGAISSTATYGFTIEFGDDADTTITPAQAKFDWANAEVTSLTVADKSATITKADVILAGVGDANTNAFTVKVTDATKAGELAHGDEIGIEVQVWYPTTTNPTMVAGNTLTAPVTFAITLVNADRWSDKLDVAFTIPTRSQLFTFTPGNKAGVPDATNLGQRFGNNSNTDPITTDPITSDDIKWSAGDVWYTENDNATIKAAITGATYAWGTM